MSYEENTRAKVECRVIPECFEVEYIVRVECKLTVPYDDAIKYEEPFAHSIVNKLKNYVINLTEVEILDSIKEQHDSIMQAFEEHIAKWRS